MPFTLSSAAAVAALAGLPGTSALAAPPESALELAALPGGAWLALDKRALSLVDADGRTLDRIEVRGESLDARTGADGTLAVLLDSNTQRVLPVRVDAAARRLRRLEPLPAPAAPVSALCLHRDAQGHDHVFVIGENGIARQWVLRGDAALAVRDLAVAPEAAHCRVDDARGQLLVSEPGGVWAHRAEAEGAPQRAAVALRRPLGPLQDGGGPIAVVPGGVAVADPKAARLLPVLADRSRPATPGNPEQAARPHWRAGAAIDLPRDSRPEQLVALATGRGVELVVRDDETGRWARRTLPASAARRSELAAALPIVQAAAQTEPVASLADAADDPAIWVHPMDRGRSRVLGTDKTRGLGVYDLQGRQLQFLEVGRVNNVDLRQGVRLGGETVDIAVATQRDDRALVVFLIDAEGVVSEAARLALDLPDIYGVCLGRAADGAAEAFVNDKDGRFEQVRLERNDGQWSGRRVRQFRVASQPEGCVVDDRRGRLFFGEERRGLWTMPSAADAPTQAKLILPVGRWLHADVEGIGLYQGEPAAGGEAPSYVVVSSQGNDSYVVLDATPPFAVRGAFRVGMNLAAGIDGTSETDGVELLSGAFGDAFPAGLLVVQDGYKQLPSGSQNFKLIDWREVVKALGLL